MDMPPELQWAERFRMTAILFPETGKPEYWIKGGTANYVMANYIGVAKDGVTPIPNGVIASSANVAFGTSGILIYGASDNQIGGDFTDERNVISGNTTDGVDIWTRVPATSVKGNFIGVNAQSTAAVANNGEGVFIANSSNNTIGGPIEKNVILRQRGKRGVDCRLHLQWKRGRERLHRN